MLEKLIIYIPLYFLGLIAGFFYFYHMWKSLVEYGTNKKRLMFSMLFRLPFPIIAVLLGSLAGIGGIIAVLLGFTTFQTIFLIKRGTKLKKEVEEEAKQYQQNEEGSFRENSAN